MGDPNADVWNLGAQTRLNEPIRIRWRWGSAKSRAYHSAEAGYEDNRCAVEDYTEERDFHGEPWTKRVTGHPAYNGMWCRCFVHGDSMLVVETVEEALGALHEMNYRRSYSTDFRGCADAWPAEARSWERVGRAVRDGLEAQGLPTTEDELLTLTYYG